jgi:hypothetical protein
MSLPPAGVCPAIGLDVGTSRVVAARRAEPAAEFRSELNAFVTIPYSALTLRSLERERVPHAAAEGEITVFGNHAARVADLLGCELRRPMQRGVLNPAEDASQPQLAAILAAVLGPPEPQPSRICFSVPATGLGAPEQLNYHEATIRQVLEALGYRNISSVNEGMAVIYSELEDTNYTGLGISFGGGLCNVAAAYLAMPLFSFSLPKGGDFIDAQAATATGELNNRVRLAKEERFYFNGYPPDKVQQALAVYYDDMIQSVVAGLGQAIRLARNAPRFGRAVPLVLSGGSVIPAGFKDRFEAALGRANLPLEISELRVPARPLEATARGALVAALSG